MGMKEMLILFIPLILLMVFLAVVIAKDCREHPENYRRKQPKFDERQLSEQARTYTWAFWTLAGYLFLWFFVENVMGRRLWEGGFGAMLGLLLGCGVFLIACAFRDAFVRVGYKSFWMVVLINNLNLFNVINLARKEPTEALISGGVLMTEAAVWLLPLFFLEFDVAALVYWLRNRRKKEE